MDDVKAYGRDMLLNTMARYRRLVRMDAPEIILANEAAIVMEYVLMAHGDLLRDRLWVILEQVLRARGGFCASAGCDNKLEPPYDSQLGKLCSECQKSMDDWLELNAPDLEEDTL